MSPIFMESCSKNERLIDAVLSRNKEKLYVLSMHLSDIQDIASIAKDRRWHERLSERFRNVIVERAVECVSEFDNLTDRYQFLEFVSELQFFFDTDALVDELVEWVRDSFGQAPVMFVPVRRLGELRGGSASKLAYDAAAFSKLRFRNGSYIEPEGIIAKLDQQQGAIAVFVDDFTGSGLTASSLATDLRLEGRNDVVFYSAISMRRAQKMVGSKVPYYAGHTFEPAFTQLCARRERYLRLESKIAISPEFSEGFRKTRALVGMRRTPNNTLPIFWADRNCEGEQWPAMLAR